MRYKLIAFDLDGVATDGSIIPVGPTMDDLVRIFNAKDSFATRFAARQGYIMAVISGGLTTALHNRCVHMGINEENLYLGVRGKLKVFNEFCERNGLKPEFIDYVLPLIQGEPKLPLENSLPRYARLKKVLAK